MSEFIPVNEPLLNGNEKKYLSECIDSGWISSEGPFVEKLEAGVSSRVGREHGIAVSSGTAALDVAVAALDLGKGDEVIVPTFTIISCVSSLVRAGVKPVLIDCDPDTWNMDVAKLEGLVSSATKAIMVVHIYGLPVDMDPVLELAEKHSLKIIEDAAELLGQSYYDRPCGSFGDISVFSFYPNKHVTTGEGGMLVTDSYEIAERCRSFRNLCFEAGKRFVHSELGWNYRMSNLQAAVGCAQLERLDETIVRKREIGNRYYSGLRHLHMVQLPLASTVYASNIYWVYGIVLSTDAGMDAKTVMQKLAEHKVGARAFFWPMHQQPVFNNMGLFSGIQCPVAEQIARYGLYLPSGVALTDKQIDRVIDIVSDIL